LSKTDLNSTSVASIAANLKHVPRLQHLDISENQFRCFDAMMSFCDSLINLTKLESLNLSGNHLEDQVVCKLAKVISIHGNMKVLKLNYVEMGPIALSALKVHLRTCSKLKVVSLAGNYFSTDLLEFIQVLAPLPGKYLKKNFL